MGRARRHHHNAQFHLRQFAEPMFGTTIKVFERGMGKWDPAPRSPKGVGYEKDLYTWVNYEGQPVDDFEVFLDRFVDTPCAGAMKKFALDPDGLSEEDKELIARFIGFSAARSPELMHNCEENYFENLPEEEIADLDSIAKRWEELVKKPVTGRDVVKGGFFDALINRGLAWRDRILGFKWHFMRTARHEPFIISDWPAWGQRYEEWYIVSFPVSSELAMVASDHPHFGIPDNGIRNVIEMNKQTLHRAGRFIACHQESFPGDDLLAAWLKANSSN